MIGFRIFPSILFASAVLSAQPVKSVWIQGTPPAGSTAAAAKIRPDVHSVEFTDAEVIVRSAGLSLAYLGALEAAPVPRNEPRQFTFRFPLYPRQETGVHAHVPAEYVGAFVNGVPIYNQFEAASYRGQNLWHYDLIARGDDGTRTAAGHPRKELTHASRAGLLEGLIPSSGQHSPIIGYAFDGFPIYGPWGSTKEGLRRMRSSYRLRRITRREKLPDGSLFAPGQEGPAVNAEYPLGTFAEDYEYVPGLGDLDQYNGRITTTPNYPEGIYAYFLATSEDGRLAFPYLLAHEYYGSYYYANKFAGASQTRGEADQLRTQFRATGLTAAQPTILQFQILDKLSNPIRHLEYVHERPIHLMIVSQDLQEFAHIHPEVNEFGVWEVSHTFPRGGKYQLYADFAPPGEKRHLENFEVIVTGQPRPKSKLAVTPATVKTSGGVPVTIDTGGEIHALTEFEIRFQLGDGKSPVAGLQPYLGAWAHIAIASEDLYRFSHAHPLEEGGSAIKLSEAHVHTPETLGPAPKQIRIPASFVKGGLYKIWLQIQIAGKVETIPFVVSVTPPEPVVPQVLNLPPDGIRIAIDPSGFDPARIFVPERKPFSLVFLRSAEANCGSKVVFPDLGITRDIPYMGVVVVELPPLSAGEIRFTCGMGMYRGSIVAVRPPDPE